MITTTTEPPLTAPAEAPRRTGLAGLVQRHPLLSFFLLANLLSWAAWTPLVLSADGLGVWGFSFPRVLGSTQLTGVLPGGVRLASDDPRDVYLFHRVLGRDADHSVA